MVQLSYQYHDERHKEKWTRKIREIRVIPQNP